VKYGIKTIPADFVKAPPNKPKTVFSNGIKKQKK